METNIIEKKLKEAALKEAVRKYNSAISDLVSNPIFRMIAKDTIEFELGGLPITVYSSMTKDDVEEAILKYADILMTIKVDTLVNELNEKGEFLY